MPIGRLMTFAVRQALAEASRAAEASRQADLASSSKGTPDPDAAKDDNLPEGTLIPCSASSSVHVGGSTTQIQANGQAVNGRKQKKRKRRGNDEGSKEPNDEPVVVWTLDTMPQDLVKYWHQRHRLFSLFDSGIQLDRESWYSVTPERIAQQIAERCRCNVIVDAFCGAGGNAIQFAMTCAKVIAIDIDPVKIRIARHNAELYEVEDTIEFICGDFMEWAREQPRGSADVVFLSPPWGGIEYLSSSSRPEGVEASYNSLGTYTLRSLAPRPGAELFALARNITPDVAMFLPRNVDLHEVGALAAPDEIVEVEEEWMGRKCKAVTAYFGGLVGEGEEEGEQ